MLARAHAVFFFFAPPLIKWRRLDLRSKKREGSNVLDKLGDNYN